jgi:hypothetical protein
LHCLKIWHQHRCIKKVFSLATDANHVKPGTGAAASKKQSPKTKPAQGGLCFGANTSRQGWRKACKKRLKRV